jgi:UDP-glucose 4-epimerase
MQNTKKIIVTGAAGYIGGQICIELKKKGYFVIGVDIREKEHLMPYYDIFLKDNFASTRSYRLLSEHNIDAIVHCAGTSLVGPSLKSPSMYFFNNVENTHNYLNVIKNCSKHTKFIFSSSAAVYGIPKGPLTETHPTDPISPYGDSKMMVEKMLSAYNKAYGIKFVAFRYFNACGADEEGLHGQEKNATHILAKLFECANTPDGMFSIYGVDYDTRDGTCIRDYIHVQDIADAHIMAIDNNMEGIYNIGSGSGWSNLEVQTMVEKYLNKKLVTTFEPRREGDPATLIANPDKLYSLGFTPKRVFYDIIKSLAVWYESRNYNK